MLSMSLLYDGCATAASLIGASCCLLVRCVRGGATWSDLGVMHGFLISGSDGLSPDLLPRGADPCYVTLPEAP